MHLACDACSLRCGRELRLLVALDQQLARTVDDGEEIAFAATHVHADQGADEAERRVAEGGVDPDLEHGGPAQHEHRGEHEEPGSADPVADPRQAGRAVDRDAVAGHEQEHDATRHAGEEPDGSQDHGGDEGTQRRSTAPEQGATSDRDHDQGGDVDSDVRGLGQRAARIGRGRSERQEQADQRDQDVGEERVTSPEPPEETRGTRKPQLLVLADRVAAASRSAHRPTLRVARAQHAPRDQGATGDPAA